MSDKARSALDAITKKIALELTEEIQSDYETAIKKFYDDYTPNMYDRTYSAYMASDHYGENKWDERKTKIQRRGHTYVAGIYVDPAYIEGTPYYNHWGENIGAPMDTAWVFDRLFDEGIHGFSKDDSGNVPPWKHNTPKVMSPTPVDKMNSAFKRTTSKKNINEKIDKYIDDYFDVFDT